jgi:hypothetical protein
MISVAAGSKRLASMARKVGDGLSRVFQHRMPAHDVSRRFEEAEAQYRSANAELAIQYFYEFLNAHPEDVATLERLALVYAELVGDIEECLRLRRYARRLRQGRRARTGISPCRLLSSDWASEIGRIASIGTLIERELLAGRDPKNILLDISGQPPANSTLLDKIGAYITIATRNEQLPCSRDELSFALEDDMLWESVDGLTKHWWHASSEVARAWETARHAPLLSLTEREITKGSDCVRQLGIPDGAWFVCLQATEGSGQAFHIYEPAVRAITERGGWVITLDDAPAVQSRSLAQTVHYGKSSLRSDWLDIFLLARCRFFAGTSSGLSSVPPLFGTPRVLVNCAPGGKRPFHGSDIYLPLLYQAGTLPHPLSFAEIMAPPIGYASRYVHAQSIGLTPVPNSAEDVLAAVTEMLDRLDGKLSYSGDDEILQSAFDAVAETNVCIGNARIGRAFLRRHSNLLWSGQPAP